MENSMEKLKVTQVAKNQFKTLGGVELINNARGAVYLHGTMRGVTAVISKILVLNPGVRLSHLSTAPVKVIDGESVVVNACAVFEDDKLSSKGE
jgi:hypothetical protein